MDFTSTMTIDVDTHTVRIVLVGELDSASAPRLNDLIHTASSYPASELVLEMTELTYMSSAGLRSLVFAHQKMGSGVQIVLRNTRPEVAEVIEMTGFQHSVVMSSGSDV